MTAGLTGTRRVRPCPVRALRAVRHEAVDEVVGDSDSDSDSLRRMRMVAREVLLLAGLLLVYQASRLLGGRDVREAFENSALLLDLERTLGLPSEQAVQSLLLAAEPLVPAANAYYATAHLPVTAGALLWLLLARPRSYPRTRRALLGATGVALAIYLLLPVAPPRMLPGFVATAAAYGQSVYGTTGASALANQYAALPSLHVGWAVLVAGACIAAGHTRWRWLWLAHPLLTIAVVVATGNHFWLDAVLGALLVGGAWQVAGRPVAVIPARVSPAQASPAA